MDGLYTGREDKIKPKGGQLRKNARNYVRYFFRSMRDT